LNWHADRDSGHADRDSKHADIVASLACGLKRSSCIPFITPDFHTQEFVDAFEEKVVDTDVVNMSFSTKKPKLNLSMETRDPRFFNIFKAEFEKKLKAYTDGKQILKDIVSRYPNKLFVISSGNGFQNKSRGRLSGFLQASSEFYPAAIEQDNTLKVLSLDRYAYRNKDIENSKLAPYANYSLTHVDVGIVEPFFMTKSHGESYDTIAMSGAKALLGTSFSAPIISRIADQVLDQYPQFSNLDVKEIIMKSCRVKNIDQAISASKDYLENGEESKTFKAMAAKSVKKRKERLAEIGDILFVKCGGAVITNMVKICAANFANGRAASITEACLHAHSLVLHADTEAQNKLKELWELRSI